MTTATPTRCRSNCLDQHPERIRPGDILVIALNDSDPDKLHAGDVVVISAELRDRAGVGVTLLRQFLPPDKLVTNSSGANSIFSLGDNSLPFVPRIRGRVISVSRPMGTAPSHVGARA